MDTHGYPRRYMSAPGSKLHEGWGVSFITTVSFITNIRVHSGRLAWCLLFFGFRDLSEIYLNIGAVLPSQFPNKCPIPNSRSDYNFESSQNVCSQSCDSESVFGLWAQWLHMHRLNSWPLHFWVAVAFRPVRQQLFGRSFGFLRSAWKHKAAEDNILFEILFVVCAVLNCMFDHILSNRHSAGYRGSGKPFHRVTNLNALIALEYNAWDRFVLLGSTGIQWWMTLLIRCLKGVWLHPAHVDKPCASSEDSFWVLSLCAPWCDASMWCAVAIGCGFNELWQCFEYC